jgi:hypothetical protein
VEYKKYLFFILHSHPTLCALGLYNVLLDFLQEAFNRSSHALHNARRLLALWSAWLDLLNAYFFTFYFICSISRASVHLLCMHSLSFALNRVHVVLETRKFGFSRVQPPRLYIVSCYGYLSFPSFVPCSLRAPGHFSSTLSQFVNATVDDSL